jgi:hypothetical protein
MTCSRGAAGGMSAVSGSTAAAGRREQDAHRAGHCRADRRRPAGVDPGAAVVPRGIDLGCGRPDYAARGRALCRPGDGPGYEWRAGDRRDRRPHMGNADGACGASVPGQHRQRRPRRGDGQRTLGRRAGLLAAGRRAVHAHTARRPWHPRPPLSAPRRRSLSRWCSRRSRMASPSGRWWSTACTATTTASAPDWTTSATATC